MKSTTFALAALAQLGSAHYFFDVSIAGGAASSQWQFIREFTRPTAFNPIKFSSNPAADIRDNSHADGDDIVCNQGAFSNAGKTQVLEVAAGSEVTVKLGVGAKMEHPGPGLVYMSRAPNDDVKSYSGIGGDWFKIFEEGVCNDSADFTREAWCTWGRDTMSATIPADTPAGEYLMRFEHIGIHRSHVNQPEHYTSCVQVKVTGNGSGTPGPTFVLPGGYKDTDAYATFSIYGGHKAFPMPGPQLWSGGNSGGSSTAPATGNDGDSSAATPAPSSSPATGGNNGGSAPAPSAPAAGGDCAGQWQQCGGAGFTGPKCCSSGKCTKANDWYSQCI